MHAPLESEKANHASLGGSYAQVDAGRSTRAQPQPTLLCAARGRSHRLLSPEVLGSAAWWACLGPARPVRGRKMCRTPKAADSTPNPDLKHLRYQRPVQPTAFQALVRSSQELSDTRQLSSVRIACSKLRAHVRTDIRAVPAEGCSFTRLTCENGPLPRRNTCSEAEWRTSRPIRRVLSPPVLAGRGETAIHLGLSLPAASCGLPADSGGQPSVVRAGASADAPS